MYIDWLVGTKVILIITSSGWMRLHGGCIFCILFRIKPLKMGDLLSLNYLSLSFTIQMNIIWYSIAKIKYFSYRINRYSFLLINSIEKIIFSSHNSDDDRRIFGRRNQFLSSNSQTYYIELLLINHRYLKTRSMQSPTVQRLSHHNHLSKPRN